MIFDKLPVVLLSAMAAEKTSSTNHTIASYILSHCDLASEMNITDLAAACYVGTGSVSRFVREIGLESYSQLRQLIRESDFSFHPENPDAPYETRRDTLAGYISSAIDKAAKSMDHQQIVKLCRDIHDYERVSAFGLLKAQSAAVSLQTDLLMMGKHIHTSTAYNEQIENIMKADKSDLIVIFSYTGSYFSSVSLRAREQHLLLPKIWMVCGEGSSADWFVDETLTFASDAKRGAHPFLLETAASLITNEYAVLYR
jgi:DNA-binding MurR/RpiR family transcriptional regulator